MLPSSLPLFISPLHFAYRLRERDNTWGGGKGDMRVFPPHYRISRNDWEKEGEERLSRPTPFSPLLEASYRSSLNDERLSLFPFPLLIGVQIENSKSLFVAYNLSSSIDSEAAIHFSISIGKNAFPVLQISKWAAAATVAARAASNLQQLDLQSEEESLQQLQPSPCPRPQPATRRASRTSYRWVGAFRSLDQGRRNVYVLQ